VFVTFQWQIKSESAANDEGESEEADEDEEEDGPCDASN
jgi:hypothetical protein